MVLGVWLGSDITAPPQVAVLTRAGGGRRLNRGSTAEAPWRPGPFPLGSRASKGTFLEDVCNVLTGREEAGQPDLWRGREPKAWLAPSQVEVVRSGWTGGGERGPGETEGDFRGQESQQIQSQFPFMWLHLMAFNHCVNHTVTI